MGKKVIVSVVCYNNEEEILKFAFQLAIQHNVDSLLLIVTCCACNDIRSFMQKLEPIGINVKIYNPGENLGYLNGALYGLKMCNDVDYEWVAIGNTDISFLDNNFFDNFVNDEYPKNVQCVGPDVLIRNNRIHKNPYISVRPQKWKIQLNYLVSSSIFLYIVYSFLFNLKNLISCNTITNSQYTYGVHGCFFFLRHDCVERLEKEIRNIFMYAEENLIAEIIRENGCREYYDANLHLVHEESKVTGLITNKQKLGWKRKSLAYLLKKFYLREIE